MSRLPSASYSTAQAPQDKPKSSISLTLPSSARGKSSFLMDSTDQCKHKKVFPSYRGFKNCSECGVVLLTKDCAIRDKDLCVPIDIPQMELYLTMLKDEAQQTFVKYSTEMANSRKEVKDIIDWLFAIGDQFKQRNLTVHISIVYLERVLQMQLATNITQTEMRTMALACLLIASKYDELDDNIPYLRQMIRKVGPPIGSYLEAMKWQDRILKAFDYDLMVLTPLNFIECLVAQGVVFESDSISNGKTRMSFYKESPNKPQTQKALQSVRKYSEFFADLACHHYELKKYSISQIAVACIVCARKKNQIEPLWNPCLEQITSYKWETIKPIQQSLYQFFEVCFEGAQSSNQSSPHITKSTISKGNKLLLVSSGISNLKKAQIKSHKQKKIVENTLKKVINGNLAPGKAANKENIDISFGMATGREKVMSSSLLQPLFSTSSRQSVHQSQVMEEYQAFKPSGKESLVPSSMYSTASQNPVSKIKAKKRESMPSSSEYYNQFKSSSHSVSPLKDLANYMSVPQNNPPKKVTNALMLQQYQDKKSLLGSQSAVSLLNATKFAQIILQKDDGKQSRRQSVKPLSKGRPMSSKLAQFHLGQTKETLALKRMRSNKEMLAYIKENFLKESKSRSVENLNKQGTQRRKPQPQVPKLKTTENTVQLHLLGSLTNRYSQKDKYPLNMSTCVAGVSEYCDPQQNVSQKKLISLNSKRLSKKIAQSTLNKCASQVSSSIISALRPQSTKSQSNTREETKKHALVSKPKAGNVIARHASYLHIVDEEDGKGSKAQSRISKGKLKNNQ